MFLVRRRGRLLLVATSLSPQGPPGPKAFTNPQCWKRQVISKLLLKLDLFAMPYLVGAGTEIKQQVSQFLSNDG
jgi:hypothetical protein